VGAEAAKSQNQMTSQRWERLKELLISALEVAPDERAMHLDRVCEPSLRRDVERLLAAGDAASADFLPDPSTVHSFAPASQHGAEPLIGRQIGSYRIVDQIGRGGMGEVYRAVRADEQFDKQVAVKLVRSGHNSEAVVQRFKNERQILASLDHSNIARLLDGGTTGDGLPYFVMELIDGLPIDEYCDLHRLTVSERLALFRQVCLAVHYAHQHLIIHRDVKPSNILVTSDGVPKLLDFGIAKILGPTDDGYEPTRTILRAFTPEYASPEQVTNGAMTTATDVYSLGIVLYELLTGLSPYRLTNRTPQEITRVVCEIEPEKPSCAVRRVQPEHRGSESQAISPAGVAVARLSSPDKLKKSLAGDLDNIVLMALRKEPQRRYVSVQEFAHDIQRHLTSLPVVARKDTLGYRTAKFVNRHRAAVLAACVIGITLVSALVLLVRANRIARQQSEMARGERARAERRFNDLRKLANSMIFDLPKPIHALPGSVAVEKMLFDSGLKYLDSLAVEAGDDVSLQRELAAGYKQLGDSMGGPYGSNVGDFAGAVANYRKALQIRETIARNALSNIQDQVDLAKTYRTLGFLLQRTGDLSAARDDVQRAREIMQPIAEAHGGDIVVLNELSVDYLTQGFIDQEGLENGPADQPAIALGDFLKSFEIVERIAKLKPDFVAEQTVFMLGVISGGYIEVGKPAKAIECARQGLQLLAHLKAADPTRKAVFTSVGAGLHSMLGNALLFSGHSGAALAEYEKEAAGFRALFDPTDYNSQVSLADGEVNEGHAREVAGDAAAGLREIKKGIELLEQAGGPSSTDVRSGSYLAMYYMFEGEAFEHLGNLREALDAYQKVVDQSHLPPLAVFPRTKLLAAAGLASIARVLAKLGRITQAGIKYNEALRLAEPAATSKAPSCSALYVLTAVYAGLGNLALKTGTSSDRVRDNRSEACHWFQKSADTWKQVPEQHPLAPNGFKVTDSSNVPAQLIRCK